MKIIQYFKAVFLLPLLLAPFIYGCSDSDNDGTPEQTQRFIRDLTMPSSMILTPGQTVALAGRGFLAADIIIFEHSGGQTQRYPITTDGNVARLVFGTAAQHPDGQYTLYIERSGVVQTLGQTIISVLPTASIPDIPGMTVKGMVYCDGQPVEGVLVSDGVLFTRTDADGFYWLASEKLHGYVFMSVPSGYEAPTVLGLPDFWSSLYESPMVTEERNFKLERVDDQSHVIIAATDFHLANRNNDISQFQNFVNDVEAYAPTFAPRHTFGIALGDMTWDTYWYTNKYTLTEYRNKVRDSSLPLRHIMGNHDNDPAIFEDFIAEAPYKRILGPSFYSFDKGSVHYVVLDNIVYTDQANYQRYVTAEQLAWLREDLSYVEDKTKPVVVFVHCPLYYIMPNFGNGPVMTITGLINLQACFTEFSEVHFFSGHRHVNYTVEISDRMMEHNVGAVCATWWWTGYITNGIAEICRDGSYSGYEVIEVDGTDVKWHYKSIGHPADKQFRAYDMNNVKTYFRTDPAAQRYLAAYPSAEDFQDFANNTVMINVWGYDTSWQIDVTEAGTPLTAQRVYACDPLHTLSYDIPRYATNGSINEGFATNPNAHMFLVQASSPSSTLEISVTDRFGNVYRETMDRTNGKKFELTME